MGPSILIYDIEIEKAIAKKGEKRLDGIEYCDGWHDHVGMGVSCICAYDYKEDRYRAFMQDNLAGFKKLTEERDIIVGFNSIAFDAAVLRASSGIHIPDSKAYDLLVEIWVAAGLQAKFNFNTHVGYSLDLCCDVNFGMKKSGDGALAPVLFQRKQYGALIDYCMNDVILTRKLLEQAHKGLLISPKDMRLLSIRRMTPLTQSLFPAPEFIQPLTKEEIASQMEAT